jgi:hypothetical protein
VEPRRQYPARASLLDATLEAIRGLGYDAVQTATLASPDTRDWCSVYAVGRNGSRHVIVVKHAPDGFRAFVPVALPDDPERQAEALLAWLVENVGLGGEE